MNINIILVVPANITAVLQSQKVTRGCYCCPNTHTSARLGGYDTTKRLNVWSETGADLRILKVSEGPAFEHASIIMLFSCIHVLEVHKRTQRVSINPQIGDPLTWEPNISSYRVSEIMNPSVQSCVALRRSS